MSLIIFLIFFYDSNFWGFSILHVWQTRFVHFGYFQIKSLIQKILKKNVILFFSSILIDSVPNRQHIMEKLGAARARQHDRHYIILGIWKCASILVFWLLTKLNLEISGNCYCQKSKFSSKIKIFVKNQNIGQKSKIKIFVRNQNFR